jgi:hypothetical protein
MYQILNVLKESPTQDLMTIDEAKNALRIPATDTSKDAEITMIISGASMQIAKMANRVFGYEQVHETFYSGFDTHERIYFSRWPIKTADLVTLTIDGTDIVPALGMDWVLEEKTGTLQRTAPGDVWQGTVDAVYSAGYKLPDEVPDDLKRIAGVGIREDYYTYLRGAIMSGVRMLSHKHARVMFYPPGQIAQPAGAGGIAGTPTWNAINAALRPYIRHWA